MQITMPARSPAHNQLVALAFAYLVVCSVSDRAWQRSCQGCKDGYWEVQALPNLQDCIGLDVALALFHQHNGGDVISGSSTVSQQALARL